MNESVTLLSWTGENATIARDLLGNLWVYDSGPRMILKVFARQITREEKLCNENCSLAKCNYPPNVVINLKIKTMLVDNEMSSIQEKINETFLEMT